MLCLFIKVEKEYVHNLQADINSHLKVKARIFMLVSEKGNRALYILAATVQGFIYNVYVSKEHNSIVGGKKEHSSTNGSLSDQYDTGRWM